MIEPLLVTLLPVSFLILLFGGSALFRLKNIDMDGEPPINGRIFYASKYSILVLWVAMVLQAWGVDLSVLDTHRALRWASLGLWALGFALMFIGRFGLGESFRLGSPKERTSLKVAGLFRFSRNPMYVGVYATLLASVLYTANPLLLFLAAFVVAVHHLIIKAEEEHLRSVFGQEYTAYCARVRRYL